MISTLNVAVSGMIASAARLSASASNIANAQTVGALSAAKGPAPYTPVDVVQASEASAPGVSGVATTYRPRTPAFAPEYQPNSPLADPSGMVAVPNVDLADEAVSAAEAAVCFRANVVIFKAANQMMKRLLDSVA